MPVQAGTYLIQNVATGNVMDLANGASAENTLVIGWEQLPPPWLDYQLVRSHDLSGTYLRAPNHADGFKQSTFDVIQNQEVVGGTPPDAFKFTDFDGSYQIGVTDEALALYLANGENDTPVILQVANNADNGQFWYMHEYTA
ncbi:predicted protein [Postia placenta Mad-698-R]|nr:predicted protein [Postia placenta Mad-698-R]